MSNSLSLLPYIFHCLALLVCHQLSTTKGSASSRFPSTLTKKQFCIKQVSSIRSVTIPSALKLTPVTTPSAPKLGSCNQNSHQHLSTLDEVTMGKNDKAIKEFVDGINDEHFKNFEQREYTVKEDHKLGMRLDHQGMNKDGTHRIYIQPLKHGKARSISKLASSKYVAQIHCVEGADPEDVRKALIESAKGLGALVKV